MGSDIEKVLALYERPDIRDCILDFNNESMFKQRSRLSPRFPGRREGHWQQRRE